MKQTNKHTHTHYNDVCTSKFYSRIHRNLENIEQQLLQLTTINDAKENESNPKHPNI